MLTLSIITLVVFLGHLVPTDIKILLYSVSINIKEILLFIMPFIIFVLIFSSINHIKKSVVKFILLLIITIFLSNLISSLIAYFVGNFIAQEMHLRYNLIQYSETITPLWIFKLVPPISNFQALIYGFLTYILTSLFFPYKSKELSYKIMNLVLFMLKTLLIPLIPIFILGFALKMQHEKVLHVILKDYSVILSVIAFIMYFYIFFLYGLANSFRIKSWTTSITNMMPAFITAISTMSSSIAMPLTLEASKKNIQQNNILSSVIPIISNFHLVGDCFFIIILAIVMKSGHSVDYVTFISYFLLYKFSVAAVPGGGIIVMLPILEKYMQFPEEMLSLIIVLYIACDPIITSANVMGNGAFAIIFTKLYKKLCLS